MRWTAFHKLEIDSNGTFARLAAADSGERRLLAVSLKAWPSVRVPLHRLPAETNFAGTF